MKKPNIVRNVTGEFDEEVLFEFAVPEPKDEHWVDGMISQLPAGTTKDSVIRVALDPSYEKLAMSQQSSEQWVTGWTDDSGIVSHARCRKCDTPARQYHWQTATCCIKSGSKLPQLFASSQRDGSGQFSVVVSKNLADQVTTAGFACDFRTVQWAKESLFIPDGDYRVLNFSGLDCERPFKVIDKPNECPFCGLHQPLVCQHCYSLATVCRLCDKPWFTTPGLHKGKSDKRLIIQPPASRGRRIINGKNWDGNDFVFGTVTSGGANFVTKRAVHWFKKRRIGPFIATPARFDVDGLTRKQLDLVKRAKTRIG